MASDAGEISRLLRDAHRSLAPAPFPPRRDIDVAALATECDEGVILFHDIFWPRQDRLACFVVRIGGAAGSLMAHALRALLRAGLRSHTPDRALALSLDALRLDTMDRVGGVRVDAAAATLAITTGEAAFAHRGTAAAGLIGKGIGKGVGKGGGTCWLAVGPVPALTAWDDPPEAHDLVRAALAGTRATAALAVALKRGPAGPGRTFVLANEVAQISPILGEMEEHLRGLGADPQALAGLEVALDELLTNIVLYAYRDGQAHEIIIQVDARDGRLRIEIRDDGTPFDPTRAEPPDLEADLDDRPLGGLGLHIVRTVFETVAYRRTEGWNVLVLTKPLPAGRNGEPRT